MNDIPAAMHFMISSQQSLPLDSVTVETSLVAIGLDFLDKINLSFTVEYAFARDIPSWTISSPRNFSNRYVLKPVSARCRQS